MGDLLSLKDDPSTKGALEMARAKTMDHDQVMEQRVSFIHSSMDSDSCMTREQIRAVLEGHRT